MGFSYTSVSGTTAHTHSNTAGDGGSLNSSTLLNNGSLYAQVLALG